MKKILLIFIVLIASSLVKVIAQDSDLLNVAKIQDEVRSRRISSYDTTGKNDDRLTNIEDGQKATIFDVKGAGVINHIWITIAPLNPEITRNDIILRMYWDGNEYPSVESPIGPFFGQGWNESYNFSTLPLAAAARDGNALVSYFAMPFEKGARIEIENQSGKTIHAFYYYIDYQEYDRLPEGLGRFHAWYNKKLTLAPENGESEWNYPREYEVNDKEDENYLIADIKGKGQFVGVNYYIINPSPVWYGEGDDMFYIDGDERPTLHGTGTEDYFNTSWSPNEEYNHPYFGAARVNEKVGWLGRTHVYRFHITDPVYFEKSLKFTIEHGHANGLTLDLASVAYWYQEKAASIPQSVSKEDRQPLPDIGVMDIFKWRQEWRKNKDHKRDLWGNEK